MPRLTGLAAVGPANARILILGSFPSAESLARQQYYAKRSNRFWKLIGTVYGENDFTGRPYADKLALLIRVRIALWDTAAACERPGSADSRIRQPAWNDIPGFLATHPDITRIILNGSTSARFFADAAKDWPQPSIGIPQAVQCLSTSAANQRWAPWERLRENWAAQLLTR